MKQIKKFPSYLIDEEGNIYNKKGIRLTPKKHTAGYLSIRLYQKGKHHNCYIHRLLADTYINNPDNKSIVNHIDGNKHNNIVSNLEWLTASESSQHAYATGLAKSGERSTSAKLTDKEVNEVRRRYKEEKITYLQLGQFYKVSKQQIERIINYKRRKHDRIINPE